MSVSAVWGAGVKEDSEKFSEKKQFLSVTVTDLGGEPATTARGGGGAAAEAA